MMHVIVECGDPKGIPFVHSFIPDFPAFFKIICPSLALSPIILNINDPQNPKN